MSKFEIENAMQPGEASRVDAAWWKTPGGCGARAPDFEAKSV